MTIMIPTWVNGKLEPFEKLKAHQLGLRHKAVSVFVLRGKAVLIQRRALKKYHTPGLWANSCCTHPEWNESADHCAKRRLREELGITGIYPEQRHNLEYRAEVGNGLVEHEVVDVYVAEADNNMPLYPNPIEVIETDWIDYQDLIQQVKAHPEKFTPWLKIYLKDYAQEIFEQTRDLE